MNLGTPDETSHPNISGDPDATKAADRARYETYKQTLKTWFRQLGEKSAALASNPATSNLAIPTITFLNQMGQGIADMENGFYDLIDNEFELIDLEEDENWQPFKEVKKYLYAALAEYEKSKLSPTFFDYLDSCRRSIRKFIKQLESAELPANNAGAENPGSEHPGGAKSQGIA